MIKVAKKSNIQFFVVTQILDYPLNILEDLSKNFKPDINIIKKISMRDNNWHHFLRQLDAINIQSDLTHSYNNVRMFNLYGELYKAKKRGIQFFYDVVHFTPEGNDVIGRVLALQIKQYLIPNKNNE